MDEMIEKLVFTSSEGYTYVAEFDRWAAATGRGLFRQRGGAAGRGAVDVAGRDLRRRLAASQPSSSCSCCPATRGEAGSLLSCPCRSPAAATW